MIYIWDTIETQNTIKTYVSYHSCEFKTDCIDTEHNSLIDTVIQVTVTSITMFISFLCSLQMNIH